MPNVNNSGKEWISLYQRQVGPLPAKHDKEYSFMLETLARSQAFILPEYFSIYKELNDINEILQYSHFTFRWLEELSRASEAKNTLLIGGSLVGFTDKMIVFNGEKFAGQKPSNILPVFYEGALVYFYKKRNLFGKEPEKLSPGSEIGEYIHPASQNKWGFLICADVNIPNVFNLHAQSRYIAIPTASPFRPNDTAEEQNERDKHIYMAGAKTSDSIVFKCCSTGQVATGGPISSVQGRSLIVSGHTIINKAPAIDWTGILDYNTKTQSSRALAFNR